MRETGHQRGAVARLELVKTRAIDQPRDHLAHIERFARIGRNHAIQFFGRIQRRFWFAHGQPPALFPVEIGDDAPHLRQRVAVVLSEVIGHAGNAGVHIGTTQIFGTDILAGRRLHQRRAAEEDRALFFHDDGFIAHRRHIGATGGARAHHAGDLRNTLGRERGLVVEDATEVVTVREHLVLQRQKRAARIDQIDAGQTVFTRDFLRAQMLLHRDRVIGAALDRGIVGHDHALHPFDPANAGHHAGAGHGVLVHAGGRQRRDFKKRRTGIEQRIDALAHQQLATRDVFFPCCGTAALRDACGQRVQFLDLCLHRSGIAAELVGAGGKLRFQDAHRAAPRDGVSSVNPNAVRCA